MNMHEAKKLYTAAVDQNPVIDDYDWEEIHTEMDRVVKAKSDRAAGRVIDWWGCWDRKMTATRQARIIREKWQEMQK